MAETSPASAGKPRRHFKRKPLLCPNCGKGRLIDENVDTISEVRVVAGNDSWEADYYAKCNVCKTEVGVRKLNRE
jgi:uncharacterized protein (DUF983 family)